MSSYLFSTVRERRALVLNSMRWQNRLNFHHCLQYFMYNYIVSSRCPYYFSSHFFPGDMHQEELANFLGKNRWINKKHELATFSWGDSSKTTALWLFSDFKGYVQPQSRGVLKAVINHQINWGKNFGRTWCYFFTYGWIYSPEGFSKLC